jgi:hypothetical protein
MRKEFSCVLSKKSWCRLYDKMLELYPDRVNPGGALWLTARAVKP